jgi:uncharacterized protein involved in exopolysaccharide biosynthesis
VIRLVILRLFESYFRHRWLYLVPVVAMSLASIQYVATLPTTYVVTGTMYVQNDILLSSLTALGNEGFGWSTPAQATVGELYQLLNASAFLRAIAEKTDLEVKMTQGPDAVNEALAEVRQALWVQELGSNLVLIGASHEMPRIAHQLATATINTYVQWKINLNRDESVAAQTFFADLIKNYRADVEPARMALTRYLQEHPRPARGERTEEEEAEIVRLQAAVDTAEDRLRNAQNQEEHARLALVQSESTVRQTYFVIDAPQRPLAPERSKKDILLGIALFIVAGAAISLFGIVGGALLDQTFRFPIDVKHGLSLPTLALVAETTVEVVRAPELHTTPVESAPSESAKPDRDKSDGMGEIKLPNRNGQRKRHHIFG